MKEINLLLKKKEKFPIPEIQRKRLSRVTFILLSLFFFLLFFTVGYSLVLHFRHSNLLTEQGTLKNIIESKKETEARYISFLQKISFAGKIIEGREDFGGLLSKIQTFIPEGYNPLALSVETGGRVFLSIKFPDTESVDNFLAPIVSDPKVVPNLTVNSLSKDKDDKYSINLEFKSLKKE